MEIKKLNKTNYDYYNVRKISMENYIKKRKYNTSGSCPVDRTFNLYKLAI